MPPDIMAGPLAQAGTPGVSPAGSAAAPAGQHRACSSVRGPAGAKRRPAGTGGECFARAHQKRPGRK